MDLVTGEGLGRIEIETGVDDEPVPIWSGTADIRDAFHRMGMPEWLRRYFALPPLTARELGITSLEGVALQPDDKVWPLPRALPMGFSWSFYYCQEADEETTATIMRRGDLLTDRGRPLVLKLSDRARLCVTTFT